MTETEARALIVETQEWFTGLAISRAKQTLWAVALMSVPHLVVSDVRAAIRAIATREKPSGEFWSLEISEIVAVSKAEMRRRRERDGQDLTRPALAAKNLPHPDDERRAELAREVARSIVARTTASMRAPPKAAPESGPTQSIEEANERRALLHRQAEALSKEAP